MKNTIEVINDLEKEGFIKDYAIGGAIGALRWVEPFFTKDLDILIVLYQEIREEDLVILTPIYEYLKNKGYQWEGQWIIIEGVPVDFIVADKLETEAIENARQTEYDEVKVKVVTPEYLIALFLRAGRNKDIIKIEMLFNQTKVDMERLNSILDRYGLTEKFVKFREKYYGR